MVSPRVSLTNCLGSTLFAAGIVAAVVVCFAARNATAQVGVAGPAALDQEPVDLVFLPADRKILQRFTQSRELIARQRYGEAVRFLGSILDGPEDHFFQPDKDLPVHHSLKAEAQRLIGSMPRKGREIYELQYGPQARRMLDDAIADGDMARLGEVSQQLFHTKAGREATLLLGLHHLDHSRPLAAALMLRRLTDYPDDAARFEPALSLALATAWLRSENPQEARRTILQLRQAVGRADVALGGRRVRLPDDDIDPLDWLSRHGRFGPPSVLAEAELWGMVGGSPTRNAVASGDAPLLNVCWNIPTANDSPLLDSILAQLHRNLLLQGKTTLCGLQPLAVDDRILMRTACNLMAIDFATGRREWQITIEDDLEDFLQGVGQAKGANALQQLAGWLQERIWNDATYGSLSSDGRSVFTIEGLGVNVGRSTTLPSGGVLRTSAPGVKSYNRLSSHDIRTGKLRWQLGGEGSGKDSQQGPTRRRLTWQGGIKAPPKMRMAGTFFLGPPLPLMGRLYVLGEIDGEIRLFALDADSGDAVWSQQLAIPRTDLLRAPSRRPAGLSPSYVDGILVCPTSAGAIVAVDLATRSLLWGYRYDGSSLSTARRNQLMARARWMGYPASPTPGRWCDANPILSHGRVLVTPLESDSLHCLDLKDGKQLWTLEREDDLYVGCVYRQKVILVGRHAVRAVSLSETEQISQTIKEAGPARIVAGRVEQSFTEKEYTTTVPKPAWDGRSVELPDGCMPSGRGFLHDNKYFLPVDSAQVIAIDLDRGAIAHISDSRNGTIPGNLICYKNRVISQSGEGLDVFYELESARRETDRRLADDPDNAADLSLRGAILLDEGKHAEAVAALRHAYRLDDDPQTRTLLRDAMLDGLKTDFAAHRERFVGADDGGIEALLDEPTQRATFRRLMATGLHESGEWADALKYYLLLADGNLEDGDADDPSPKRSPLSTCRFSLSPLHSARCDVWVREHLGQLLNDADEETKRRIDGAVRSRMQAALETGETGRIERLEDFLAAFGMHPLAHEARRELASLLADSGELLRAELTELTDDETAPEAPPSVDWPQGEVEVKRAVARRPSSESSNPFGGETARTAAYGRYPLTYQGSIDPFFTDLTIRLDSSRTRILCTDALGRAKFGPLSLVENEANQRGPHIFYSSEAGEVRVRGHALLVAVGHRIAAIDTLSRGDQAHGDMVDGDEGGSNKSGPEPKLLWSVDLSDDRTFDDAIAAIGGRDMRQKDVPILPTIQRTAYYSRSMGALGPVIGRHVIVQQYRVLVALDLVSGEPLWIRRNVPPGSTLFGDDRFLFVVPPGKNEAAVLRTADGEMLGRRKIVLGDPLSPEIDEKLRLAFGGQVALLGDDFLAAMSATFERSCLATFGRKLLVWHQKDGQAVLRLFDPWDRKDVWGPRKFSLEAKVAVCGREAVGVLEPDGSFVLLSVDDGQTISELKLEPEPALEEILLTRLADQYFLATNNRPEEADGAAAVRIVPSQLPGALSRAVFAGRVYALDLSGQPMWDKPVEIENQHFLLNQPARLPLLTFACRAYRRTGATATRTTTSLLCVDRRTGRKVFEDVERAPSASLFAIEGDPQKKTVALHTGREKITLTLTDKPIVPAPDKSVQSSGEKTAGAAWKAIGKGLIEALGRKGGDDD